MLSRCSPWQSSLGGGRSSSTCAGSMDGGRGEDRESKIEDRGSRMENGEMTHRRPSFFSILDPPSVEMKNVTEVAPRLGVTRLIYVEVEDFGTRAPASIELFRGSMTATLKVVEVSGDNAKVGYEENGIKAVYPPHVPEDGTP